MEREIDMRYLDAAVRHANAAEVHEDKATSEALYRVSVAYYRKALGERCSAPRLRTMG